ncbi:effector binding domain-containing protein [Proteus hauseri]|uniref:effector binding domain-containing protein n=1 Tax=Proteus hauseri TaxID=183417 RepID=UPI0032D9EC2C
MQIVDIENLSLIGINHIYKSNSIEWNLNTEKYRKEYWAMFFKKALYHHNKVYATHNILSEQKNNLVISYATMIEKSADMDNKTLGYTETISNRKYLKVTLTSELLKLDYKDIIYNIYGILMKKLNIPRKKGSPDIEEYILKDDYHVLDLINKPLSLIKDVNYYIPIDIKSNPTE